MRHGPEGRDPRLRGDIEHWSVRSEMDFHGGIRFLPSEVPVTIEISVKFSSRLSAEQFERRVLSLLREEEQ